MVNLYRIQMKEQIDCNLPLTYKYNFYFKEQDYLDEIEMGNHPSFKKINVI